MNCLYGCWIVDFVMVNFCHFVKNILEKEYCTQIPCFLGEKGKQNHQFVPKIRNCLKQHERLNCLMDDCNLSNITKREKKLC